MSLLSLDLCGVRASLISALFIAVAPLAADELERGFSSPPDSAKPCTWWHWMDGSVTREGITGDLEAMKRGGLGGVYLFNSSMGMPQGPARFMSGEWLALIDHALRESKRLGLSFGVHNCDGFSLAGGPWIKAETSMKQLTWWVTEIAGPSAYSAVLRQPESNEGYYRDIAVIAFPAPQGTTLTGPGSEARIRSSLPADELAKLFDNDPQTTTRIPGSIQGTVIDFVFPRETTVRSIVCTNAKPHAWESFYPVEFAMSNDGREYHSVASFTTDWDFSKGGSITAACMERPGIRFRLVFRNSRDITLGGISLSESARVHFAEAKAARLRRRGHGAERRALDAFPGPDLQRKLAPELIVARAAVMDLTERMDDKSRLTWQVPAGTWRVLRVGYTSTGARVHPATREGSGLECDKLDATAMRHHLDQYVGKLKERADRIGAPLTAMEVDSWECGIQNWTTDFERRFRMSRGYDLLPFLPALLEGWIVDSPEITERALWDWRRSLADGFAESFFAVAADYAREKGLTLIGEFTGRQQFLYDLAYMRHSGIPMGEMWNNTEPGQGVRVDNKLAASVAHTNGKTIVATEAYTSGDSHSRWDNHPFSMKPLGDKAFCAGVNRFVFHTFAHQPYEVLGPGFTFGPWGLNFNRANTWWPQVHAWTEYLSRCQYLLRHGGPANDVLFAIGEDVPNRIGWREELRPVLPQGYDFDGCDTRSLMGAGVKNGRIILPGGAEYRVLLLPDLKTMRPAVLRKIRELVDAGAVVIGPRPLRSPSLSDLGSGDAELRKLAGELWDGSDPRVHSGISFEQLFERIGLPPSFEWRSDDPEASVLFNRRSLGEGDVFFLSNQRGEAAEGEAIFRVTERLPEWWDPATGERSALRQFRIVDGRMHVPLRLDPHGSGFVVFRGKGGAAKGKGPNWQEFAPVQEITGPWQVSFPQGLGAPESVTFGRLVSFPERQEEGIRYFSGTAAYRTTFRFDETANADTRDLFLDLGKVDVIAEVELNGSDLGVVWKPPFRVRAGDALKRGENLLVVRVTNLWRNRMIGDAVIPDGDVDWREHFHKGSSVHRRVDIFPRTWPEWLLQGTPRPGRRTAFCTRKDVYGKHDALISSGLIGPVSLQRMVSADSSQ